MDGLELPGTKLMEFVLRGTQAGAAMDGLASITTEALVAQVMVKPNPMSEIPNWAPVVRMTGFKKAHSAVRAPP